MYEHTKKVIAAPWKRISTASDLRSVLTEAVAALRLDGDEVKAAMWEGRLKGMPEELPKEAINYVLLSASFELGFVS